MKANYELNPYSSLDAVDAPDPIHVKPRTVQINKVMPTQRSQNNWRAMGHALQTAQEMHPRIYPEPQILELENPGMADDDIFLPEPEPMPVAATVTKQRLGFFDKISNVLGDVMTGAKEAFSFRKLAFAGGAALATMLGVHTAVDAQVSLPKTPAPVHAQSENANLFGNADVYHNVKQYLETLGGYQPILQHVEMWGAENVHQMLNLVDAEFGMEAADDLEEVITAAIA
jgi:hypothetical protein